MPKRSKRSRKRENNLVDTSRVFTRYPFPKVFRTKMRWCRYQDLDAGATNAIATTYVSANGAYDPASLGAGALQPYGWDNLASIYDHYTVIGSKCTVRAVKQVDTENDNDMSHVALLLNDDTTLAAATGHELMARPDVSKAILFPEKGEVVLSKNFSARRFFGKTARDREDLSAGTGANPSDQAYYIVAQTAATKSTTVNPALIRLFIQVDYIIEFSEPRDLATSNV